MCFRTLKTLICRVFCLAMCCGAVFAHPELGSVLPTGGKRGTEITLDLRGKNLVEPQDLMFYQEGLEVLKFEPVNKSHVKVKIRIKPDATLGEHAFRLRTAYGVSYQRTFWVGAYPVVWEEDSKKHNNTKENAQKLLSNEVSNCTVMGVIKTEDVDVFAVERKAGQRLSVEIECMRIGRSVTDPFISVISADGKPVISADDSPLLGQDGSLSIKAEKPGIYYIVVRSSSYEGNDNSHYRLHVGEFVRPKMIKPLAWSPNVGHHYQLLDEEGEVGTAAYAGEGDKVFFIGAKDPDGDSPLPFKVRKSNFRGVSEEEPNNYRKKPNVIEGNASDGLGIDGVLEKPRDVDFFKVFLKKGRVRADVFAAQYGSPLDSLLYLYDMKGKRLVSNDDKLRGNPDSGLSYTIPSDGQYVLLIKDRLQRGGPLYVYRIEISRPVPKVTGTLNRALPQDSQFRRMLSIPQGGQMVYKMTLQKNDFRGQLEMFARGLPIGVTMDRCVIEESKSSATFMLRAAVDAPLDGKLVKFELKGKNVKGYIREIVEHSYIPNRGIFHAYESSLVPVAVIKSSAVKIWIEQPNKPIVRNGVLDLKIKINRGGYKGGISLEFADRPGGIGANSKVTVPKGKNEVSYRINANSSAELGKHKLAVALNLSRYGDFRVGSNWVTIDVKEPMLKMKLSMASTRQGENVEVVGTLEKNELKAPCKVRLVGLPDGLKAHEVTLQPGSKTITLPVDVPDKARIGKFSHLYCVADVIVNGQIVPHAIGHGGVVRVDRKPVEKKTKPKVTQNKLKPKPTPKSQSKPLSRLEQLRQKKK